MRMWRLDIKALRQMVVQRRRKGAAMRSGVRAAAWISVVALTLFAMLYALGAVAFPQRLTSDDGHGNVYSGTVVRGDYSGIVRIDYADGAVWEGPLKNGQFDGEGLYRSPDGWTFTGAFKDGAANGPGRFDLPDGTSYEGVFVGGA
jgi:hypothetical protein